jgi:glycosyltransferase involved in cell wall biosynthesis
MRSPINIVILTPGFAADEKDTTAFPSLQLYTKHLFSHYPALNLQIITFHYPFHEGRYRWNGIQVYSLAGKGRKWYKPILWIKIIMLLFRLKKNSGINVIHSFWLSETVLTGMLFCRLTGTGFLATAMGQDVTAGNKYLRLLCRFTFNLTMISEFQSQCLEKFRRTAIYKVIPFGIEPSYYRGLATKRDVDVIGVGSLNSIKNYDRFIGVIGILARRLPGIRCRIIGEGLERTRLEKVAAEKGVHKNIFFAGSLPYEEVIKEMGSAKVLLHTATFEGQALVIMEALAAGQYVVTTPVGIATSITSKKLVTGFTIEDLASHTAEFLELPDPDFSPEIHYTMEDTCREYDTVYRQLIRRKGE